MNKRAMKKYKTLIMNLVYPLLAVGLLLSVWSITAVAVDKPIIMPSVRVVAQRFGELFSSTGFWSAVGGTLLRSLLSYVISFVLAFALAILAAFALPLHRIMSPLVTVLRAAPTMAIILLAMLWLDYQEAPVLIGFLVSFPLLYASLYSAISSVDGELLEMAKVFHVATRDRVTKIYLPAIAPATFDSLKSTVSLNLKVVIAAEVLAQTKQSIGVQMQRASIIFDVDVLLGWTVLAIILSFLAEGILALAKRVYLARRHKVSFEMSGADLQTFEGGEKE